MGYLAKLNLKAVDRNGQKDPVIARRDKLLAAIAEQSRVLAAALAGDEYVVPVKRWQKNEADERVLIEDIKRVRAWFFEQDGGWYVQCKYGARPLQLGEKGNAVFVPKLEAVANVLEAFKLAAMSGELDAALVIAVKRR